MKIIALKIALLRLDHSMQSRAKVNTEACQEYAARYEQRLPMPPIVVFFDGAVYWLGDGWHRVFACGMADPKVKFIEAEVRQGSKRDAILYSCGANGTHGVRRSNEDKRRAVGMLLSDKEWVRWSNCEIARRCGVSEFLVREVREEMAATLVEETASASSIKSKIDPAGLSTIKSQMRQTIRGGTTYTMATARIGGDGASAPARITFGDAPPIAAAKNKRTVEVTYVPPPIAKAFAKVVKHLAKHGRDEALRLMEEVEPHLAVTRNKGLSKHA